MFSTKSRDVGMVDSVPLIAAWKDQLVENVQEQGGVFSGSVAS